MNDFQKIVENAVSVVVTPHLETIESKLDGIENRVATFVPRRAITETTKKRHREAISLLGRRCPCCGVAVVLSPTGEVVEAEYDHFYSRERRAFEETWLICRSCHLGMSDRTPHVAAFQAYQSRAKQLTDGQLPLFDS